MIKGEYVYCAINCSGEIQDVLGSSKKTRYFKTSRYLSNAVEYHNKCYPDDPWRVAAFELISVPADCDRGRSYVSDNYVELGRDYWMRYFDVSLKEWRTEDGEYVDQSFRITRKE